MKLDSFEEKWGKKYPAALKSWRDNWCDLSTFFKYPQDIRKMIYTTNRIENFNHGLRKVAKAKAAYPSETALLKSIYLAIQDIVSKWDKIQGWHKMFGQLTISLVTESGQETIRKTGTHYSLHERLIYFKYVADDGLAKDSDLPKLIP